MDNLDELYNAISVIKSQICTALAKSSGLREAMAYTGIDTNGEYDPEDPMTIIWNGILPYLKDPTTIKTADPLILVGVTAAKNRPNPHLIDCDVAIVSVVHYNQMRTNMSYDRDDLIADGTVCYTRADWISDEIVKALANMQNKTWIGDISFSTSSEASVTGGSHYARTTIMRLQDVNIERWVHSG